MADYVVVREWYRSPKEGDIVSFDVLPEALEGNVLPVGFKPYDPCETKCGDSEGLEAELKEVQAKLTKAEADLKKAKADLSKAKAELETTKAALSECEAGKE